MNTLLRLPIALLELTAREGLKAARGVLRLVLPEEHPDDVRVRPIAHDEVPRPAPTAPAPSSNGPVGVQPPWEGYDSDSAAEIVQRVHAADDATKAVVLLYEGHRKRRRTVLDAAHA
jgi:hypothetical protein